MAGGAEFDAAEGGLEFEAGGGVVDVDDAGLEAAGAHFRWSEYDAEHAFGRDVGDRYNPEATDSAFADTVAGFRAELA